MFSVLWVRAPTKVKVCLVFTKITILSREGRGRCSNDWGRKPLQLLIGGTLGAGSFGMSQPGRPQPEATAPAPEPAPGGALPRRVCLVLPNITSLNSSIEVYLTLQF